jgi:hypothetical protein
LTDKLSGRELVEKTFLYSTNLTKECRKALTLKFEREHKGMLFDSIETVMRKDFESWFAMRDKNITIKHENSLKGKPGEVLMTYTGATKDVTFKIHIDGIFTLKDSSNNSPSYLKNLNIYVDKRDFSR